MLGMLVDCLEDAGHTVYVAKDGVEAMEQLDRHQPDMVITDLCVMEMDSDRRRFRVTELAPGVTRDEVAEKTTAEILFADEPAIIGS